MSATTIAFILMLITHSGEQLSLTKIKQFPSREACETAALAVQGAIGATKDLEIGCLSVPSLEALKSANR
jgi:hypothetical protein